MPLQRTSRALAAAALAGVGAWAAGCGGGGDRGPRAPEAVVLALLEDADADPAEAAGLVEVGRETFAVMECGQCHRFDRRPATGPSLAGVAGSVVRVDDPAAPGGVREVTADRRYLWESIVFSQAEHVKGFEDQTRMSRYAQVLDPEEVAGLIAWLETR